MAKLTAALTRTELDFGVERNLDQISIGPPQLDVSCDKIAADAVPDLKISSDPPDYLLYASSNPLFCDGATVASHVTNAHGLSACWHRSVNSLSESRENRGQENAAPVIVSVAVRIPTSGDRFSPLSNSVDVVVG